MREAVLKEEVDLKGKDLFNQILRAAFTVFIDNSEMGEFKRKGTAGFLQLFPPRFLSLFFFFFLNSWAYPAKCSSENDNKSSIPGTNCFYKP